MFTLSTVYLTSAVSTLRCGFMSELVAVKEGIDNTVALTFLLSLVPLRAQP